jgi:threonine synthase
VQYVSTRGAAPTLGFSDVLLEGLATDGGLYVPATWPTLPAISADAGYAEVATAIMWPFVEGSLDRDTFARLVADAYATFSAPEVVPVVDLGDGLSVAELFWGPTLAFKDIALQLVGRLFDHELNRRGARVTIVGATSGDTGSAAIDACRDRDHIDVFILHPVGRTSEVQRRQMTTVDAANVHNIAIEGTFDDCQDLVKAMFADEAFRRTQQLSAVNSINWARVMAQTVYYATSARTVTNGVAGRPASFCVPTGNFGNIFAGYGAMRMGLEVDQLVVASNRNDILTRFFTSGTMEIHEVVPTLSPSMDIQVSSNLERLLFEMLGRDGHAVAELMLEFRSEGRVRIAPDRLGWLSEHHDAGELSDDECLAEIGRTYRDTGYLMDPHTAVGVGVARRLRRRDHVPMVCLGTAHPAKFPDAVEQATGVRPPLPDHLADLFSRPERYDVLPADLATVQAYVAQRAVTR